MHYEFWFAQWLLWKIYPFTTLFVKIEIPDLLNIAISDKIFTDKWAVKYKATNFELVQNKLFMRI